MRRDRDELGEVGLDRAPAVAADPDLRAEQGLRRGRAEAHQHVELDDLELGLEPWQAGADMPAVGPLMDPALPAELVAEVLDDVRDVHVVARDPGLFECLVENPARGNDEGTALDVLAVADGLPER
jgi:hypothetical protein